METMLSTQEVADRLNLSPNTVKKLWREGRLRGSQVSERKLRFRPADVEDFLRRSAGEPPKAPQPEGYRAAEARWRAEHREELVRLAGQWVVLEPWGIAAVDPDPVTACARARERGIEVPYVFYVDHPVPPGTVRIGL